MKKLLSTSISKPLHNVGTLLLRLGFGITMIPAHGYNKLVSFSDIYPDFIDFLGMGGKVSLMLAIFAEFFCSLLIIMGLFTRFAAIPLIILCLVIVMQVGGMDFFGKSEHGLLFLIGFTAIFILGPGKISIDGLISKR